MRARALGVVAGLLLALVAGRAEAGRVVAIGDIHGSYDGLVSILRAADLLSEEGNWAGGTDTLVQTGDFLDRGAQTREVMDLLQRLQKEASAAGGRVEVLLGNHEALNLLGELGDASAESFSPWVEPGSETARDAEYKVALKAARQRAQLTKIDRPSGSAEAKRRWMEEHPPGQLEYLRSLGPDGDYGRWLRTLPVVAEVEGVVFLHGGLSPEVATQDREAITARAHEEIRRADECREALLQAGYLSATSSGVDLVQAGTALVAELRAKKAKRSTLDDEDERLFGILERCEGFEEWFLLHSAGPLWLRDYAEPRGERYGWSDEEGPSYADAVLEAQNARHLVVAHTPQQGGRINARFDGRVFLIDTGMLSSVYAGGQPSALEIENGVFTAIYPSERAQLHTAHSETSGFDWQGPDGRASFESEEAFLEFLRTAKITGVRAIRVGINSISRLTLEQDGKVVRAAFRDFDQTWRNEVGPDNEWHALIKDSFVYEVAAYHLARALTLDCVPPTAQRRYRGKSGSVQAWVEDAHMEADILEGKVKPGDIGRRVGQMVKRRLFDTLINNWDRNAGNSVTDQEWKMWFIDHGRAFLIEENDAAIAELIQADPALFESMRVTDRQVVADRLEPYLSPVELKALFERWEKILEHFDRKIEEFGADKVLISR